jgi:hypothetical protein
MKFKIDENLPIEVAELLRQTGYDATTVLEQDLGGSADTHLASLCQEERRVFVTLDTDFGDIRACNYLAKSAGYLSVSVCVGLWQKINSVSLCLPCLPRNSGRWYRGSSGRCYWGG